MLRIEIIWYGFIIAFFVVEAIPRIKLTNRKPFNCMMCMSGWSALALGISYGYEWESIGLCLQAIFAGAMFGAIKMRYL